MFYLHEGGSSGSLDYDWLNSSDPGYTGDPDYDGDGHTGITIKKYTPADRWRHFWVLCPAVNSDVHIDGDLISYVWAASRDNATGTEMTIEISDMDPLDWYDPASWTLVSSVAVALTGPVYSSLKAYDLVAPSIDYVLPAGHNLVLTVMQGDSLTNDGLIVMYDNAYRDSYVAFNTPNFITVDDLLTAGSSGEPRTVFSDSEDVIVTANISNPFGAYEILDALIHVSYSGNSTVVVPLTSMTLEEEDSSTNHSWKLYTHTLQSLPSGSLTVTVYAVDPQGSPSWLFETISVVPVDHFGLSTPTSSVTVNETFSLTLSALDALDEVIPEWVGTVQMEVYLEDMATPATGSLGVSAATISTSDAGQIIVTGQTYDYSEETITIRAVSGSHDGWSSPIVVSSGPVTSIAISPPDLSSELGAGESQEFSVVGMDEYGHVNTTWAPEWSLDGDIGLLVVDGFTATLEASFSGSGFVSCTNAPTGAFVSVSVTVDPSGLSTIVMSPIDSITIREGVTQVVTAVGYDSYGNVVDIAGAVWST
ncbi:MAG: hypothetical protein LN409_01705, partial [Candidatus Thermoplasmatota archaeon]|nr:hypothetical protein [Candidatus Thermoplasmatota archaeon]